VATVRSIGTDALIEIGVLQAGEAMDARQSAIVLRRFQNQIGAWQADRLTLSFQLPISFTLPSGTSTMTIGPAGADITAQRPVWIDAATYVIPGSSPAVEVSLAGLSNAQYAAISIKALQSALPTQFFYQTDPTTTLGDLFFWPQVTQNVTIVLYAPLAMGVPATLDTVMLGPPGAEEAFLYQLALRLLAPFGVSPTDVPLLPQMAKDALATMKRPNVDPGLMGMDAALTSASRVGGYNVLSDSSSAPSGN